MVGEISSDLPSPCSVHMGPGPHAIPKPSDAMSNLHGRMHADPCMAHFIFTHAWHNDVGPCKLALAICRGLAALASMHGLSHACMGSCMHAWARVLGKLWITLSACKAAWMVGHCPMH